MNLVREDDGVRLVNYLSLYLCQRNGITIRVVLVHFVGLLKVIIRKKTPLISWYMRG